MRHVQIYISSWPATGSFLDGGCQLNEARKALVVGGGRGRDCTQWAQIQRTDTAST